VLKQLKQAAAHRICIYVNGGLQVQGKDYNESCAHTIFLQSLKIIIAITLYLCWCLVHFDIHNDFQSTPDEGDINGNLSWLSISDFWLDYIRDCKPDRWMQVEHLLEAHSVDELAVEMLKCSNLSKVT
jgi:hypothetical protein